MTGVGPSFKETSFFNNPWRPFKNVSGETIPPFAVMKITAVDEHDDGFLRYECDIPNDTFDTRYMVNGNHSVLANKDGRCTTLAQAYRVAYNDSAGTPAINEEWGAKEDQWTLQKNRPGFIIDGGLKLTGNTNTVIARQHVVTSLKGKASSGISKGSTGSVNIYMGASGAEAATEYFITCRALGAAITADKWVVVWFESGVWYVGPWEC